MLSRPSMNAQSVLSGPRGRRCGIAAQPLAVAGQRAVGDARDVTAVAFVAAGPAIADGTSWSVPLAVAGAGAGLVLKLLCFTRGWSSETAGRRRAHVGDDRMARGLAVTGSSGPSAGLVPPRRHDGVSSKARA